MRQFIVLGHEVPADAEISLDDLPGAGRLDALCRCVNAAVFLSHAIRGDVRVSLVLRDELTVRFEANELRHAAPDERNIGSLIRTAIEARSEAIGHQEAESTPGVHVSTRGFEPVLAAAADRGTVVELHEEGTPVVDLEPPADPVFVLSDHRDFTEREAGLLAEHADHRVSLSPERLHGNHAITVAHNDLDTDGYRTY